MLRVYKNFKFMEIPMKQDLRISVTKRMIKESLLDLLNTKPLSKIKISELCEKSGVNRATFYRHYKTLQEVLHETALDFFNQLPLPNEPPQTMDEAYKHMVSVCTHIYEHADMVKLLFSNNTDIDMMHGMNEFYQEFLELRKKELPLANLDEDTVEIIMALLGGGCQSLLRKWILEDIPKTPAQIASILCHVIRWPEFLETPSDIHTT